MVTTQDIDEQFHQDSHAKIIIAPHHGSWELLNLWLANHGPLYSLYKPARSAALDQFIINKRSRNNAHLVPVNTSGLRNLMKGLKNGASCMILPDQRPGKKTSRIEAPFFHKAAPTTLLIKSLARKIDCEVFIAAMTRDLETGTYQLTVRLLDRDKFLQEDLSSASYLNSSIEKFIQSSLAQYQWPYRRFDRHLYNGLN